MPTTKEMQGRLMDLLADLKAMPVLNWLKEEREAPSDVSDTISLMLEVQAGLMAEIDLFIGSVESGGARYDRSIPSELSDLREEESPEEDEPATDNATVLR
jgi:hypothetical protein